MPQYKVTHAVFTYKKDGRRIVNRRGDLVDVPQEVADANPDALIPPDAELSTPGQLVLLIDEPSDEQIEQYLRSGTATEIISQLGNYTNEVKDKLLLAERNGLGRPTLLAALGEADALNEASQEPAQTEPGPGLTTEEDITTVPDAELAAEDTEAKGKPKKRTNE